jgi:hypothetical protein
MNNVVALPGARRSPATDEWLDEPTVLELRPMLSLTQLRGARKAKAITWTRGKRGAAWYRLADVDAFIAARHTLRVVAAPWSDINSAAPPGPAVPGLAPELEDEVADRLASQI